MHQRHPTSLPGADARRGRPAARRAATDRQRRAARNRLVVLRGREALEVAAERLLALDGLEESLEVPLAEGRRAVALDHLEENGRSVLRRLREDLQQIAVLVAVSQDLEALQVGIVLADLADAALDLVVVRVRGVEEEHAPLLHRLDGADDVLALQRNVLHAGSVVELEVLLDLALALALCRLVDRELDLAAAVRHHLRHQSRVLGLDLVVAEVDDVRHPEDALVELDPVVHATELDVTDDMVERLQADARAGVAVLGRRDVAGQVGAGVLATVDEGVDHIAVGPDRGQLDAAEVGTCSPMLFAASPWRQAYCVISLSLRRPLVTSRRMSPCSST